MHTKLVWIHPFEDGNGRTARLLLNAILLNESLPAIIVNYADKNRYISALEESDKGNIDTLVRFFVECLDEEITYLTKKQVDGDNGFKSIPDNREEDTDQGVIEKAIAEVSLKDVSLRDVEDPLAAVLEKKGEARLQEEMTRYPCWNWRLMVRPDHYPKSV